MEPRIAPRRRGRPKANETPVGPESILRAALRAFATHGYDGMSVRTLSRELGVSHNVIPQRFGNKEKLWYTAIDAGFGGFVEEIRASSVGVTETDVFEPLRDAIVGLLAYSAAHPELLGIVIMEGAVDSPRLDYIFSQYIEPAIEPLSNLVEQLADDGRIRRISPRTLYFLIAHGGGAPFTLMPLARRFAHHDSDLTVETVHARETADLIVSGLRLDDDPRAAPAVRDGDSGRDANPAGHHSALHGTGINEAPSPGLDGRR